MELTENAVKMLYSRENIPKLHEQWKSKIADLMGLLPEKLPPLLEVTHHPYKRDAIGCLGCNKYSS